MIDIRKEASFVVCKYFLNIFTLWGFFLLVAYWLSFNPIVDKFRTVLWANQFYWLLLTPLLVYVGFEVYRKFKIRKGLSKKIVIVIGIVLGVGLGIFYLDYTFFTAGIIMIIPEQHPETQKNPTEYDKLEKSMKFGEFFVLPLANVAYLRIRKKLENMKYIELGKEYGKKIRTVSICGVFLIALTWVIYYNNIHSFWSLTFS